MRKLSSAIRQIDLFGVELSLNVKQQDKYKSTCSGLLSLIMISVLSYIFITSLIQVFNRENYTLQVQSKQSRDPKYAVMNRDSFMMAVKMTDPFQQSFPDSNKIAYNYTVQQYAQQTMKNGSKARQQLQSYNLETCTEDHFKTVNFVGLEQVQSQLSTYLCLPLEYELYLQGTYNSEIFYYPKLQIQICTTEECYTKEERQFVTSNSSTIISLSTLIQSSIFMSNETENFLYQYIISDFYLDASFKTSTTADLFFKQTKVLIDDNIITQSGDLIEENFWSYDLLNYREFKNPTSQADILFQLNWRLNPQQEVITKTADKLDQLISYIGGMLKIFSAVFGLIALKYNMIALKLSLANSLYQFNIPEKNQNGDMEFSYDKLINYIQFQINRVDELLGKLKAHTFQVVKIGNITKAWGNYSTSFKSQQPVQNQVSQHLLDSPQINSVQDQKITLTDFNQYSSKLMEYKESFIEKLIQKILITRHQLKLGLNFLIYLLMCCQCQSKIKMKRQLLTECNKMVQKDLDIVNILSKIQQIDKLKSALLDDDQISVFNYTPKPVVNITKKYKIHTQETKEPNDLIAKANKQKKTRVIKKRVKYNKPQKFLKIYQSYLKLKGQNSIVNQRLIHMLGATIEMIFEKYHEIQMLSQRKEQYNKTIIDTLQKSPKEHEALTTNKSFGQEQMFQQIPAKDLNDEEIYFQEMA